MKRIEPATLVILAGVSAALHIGKLPPALPVLRDGLGISLLEAGFLLSLVQLAGMTLGLAAGLLADSAGLRRTMLAGLCLLAVASALGGWAHAPWQLLSLRAVEGLGFLLASMPAPGLIRRNVAPARLSGALGWWGANMPLGTALVLLFGPALMDMAGWQGLWWLLAVVTAVAALAVALGVPADQAPGDATRGALRHGFGARLLRTLRTPGPWLVALSFAVYSGQWISVVGFLPSIYREAGWSGGWTALATALAAAVNVLGNIGSGRFLQRGAPPAALLATGFAVMGAGAFLAFTDAAPVAAGGPALRYGAVLMFSMVGGLIPATLFTLALRLSPDEGTVSTSVGWMQQWSSLGQFAGPPLVAWMAQRSGVWHWTWTVTGTCAVAGLLLAWRISALMRDRDGASRP